MNKNNQDTKRNWLITTAPPTPNGDLHVGHIAGPYLAADIFKRARLALGDQAIYACYSDDHQSYTVTTAARLGKNIEALIVASNQDITSTLNAYDIEMDSYTRADHTQFIQDIFQKLYRSGALIEKNVPMFYDLEQERFLFESYIQGNCPVCLQHTKGGICEDCGHPNDAIDLINPSIVGETRPFEVRYIKRLVLPLEQYRDEIKAFYHEKKGTWRPHIIRLVEEILAKPLPDFPMTYPTDWGIPVGLTSWEGHVWNVWAEIGPALLYALQRNPQHEALSKGKLIQFFGFDNSYFFAIIHLSIQFALRKTQKEEIIIPEYIITNEFFHLEHKKFSTSKNHAIWGKELLNHVSSDEARLYLSLKAPELAQDNFVFHDMQDTLDHVLRHPIKMIIANIANVSDLTCIPHTKAETFPWIVNIRQRFEHFCDPEYFSPRELAKLFISVLDYVAYLPIDETEQYQEFICGVNLLCDLASPLMPGFKRALFEQSLDNFIYYNKQKVGIYG